MAEDPANWSKVKVKPNKVGKTTCYYNRVTKTLQWEKPKKMSQDNGREAKRQRIKSSNKVYAVWNNKVQQQIFLLNV